MAKNRLDYISFIQFIGVISVIFGHSMNSMDVPDVFRDIKMWVYTYHMPLFFLVSAYLFSFTGGFAHKGGYFGTFRNKFDRLLVPYILWNVLFIAPKILMRDQLPNQESEINTEFFVNCLLSPRNNVLGHTWFLCALFEMFIIAIVLEKLRKKKVLWIPVTLILVVANCFGVTDRVLAIGDLMKNGIFFWTGLLLGTIEPNKIEQWAKDKSLQIAMLCIIIAGSIIWAFDDMMLINTLVLGMAIILFLGMIQIRWNISNNMIEFISRNSFTIYITHWPVLIVLRYIIYQKMHVNPTLSMVIMFVSAIVITMILAWVLRRSTSPIMKPIKKYIFGM